MCGLTLKNGNTINIFSISDIKVSFHLFSIKLGVFTFNAVDSSPHKTSWYIYYCINNNQRLTGACNFFSGNIKKKHFVPMTAWWCIEYWKWLIEIYLSGEWYRFTWASNFSFFYSCKLNLQLIQQFHFLREICAHTLPSSQEAAQVI